MMDLEGIGDVVIETLREYSTVQFSSEFSDQIMQPPVNSTSVQAATIHFNHWFAGRIPAESLNLAGLGCSSTAAHMTTARTNHLRSFLRVRALHTSCT